MRRAAALCALVALLFPGTAAVAGTPFFADVSAGSGIPALRFGEGVNAVDLDDDDLPELFLPCVRGRDRLYRNLGGLRFADVTDAWGVTGEGGIGAAIGDLDSNGSPEIVVVRGAWPSGSVTLLSRGKDGRFADASAAAGFTTRRNGIAASIADFDGDGAPDLFVSAWGGDLLYRNLGGGRLAFEEVSREAGLAEAGRSWGALFSDLTGDGKPDLVVTRGGKGSSETTRLFVNAGGRFEDRTAATDLGRGAWAMGAVSLDCDGDGDRDLLVTGYEGPDRLYRNDGAGGLRDITAESGIRSRAGVGAAAGAVDGDLLPDLVIASFEGPVRFFRNLGDCRFADETATSGLQSHPRNEGIVLADLDADGDLDLYVTNYAGDNRLYRNTLDSPSFLKIRLPGGSAGLGTVITVRTVGETNAAATVASQELVSTFGYCSQGPEELLFRVPPGSQSLVTIAAPGAQPRLLAPRPAGILDLLLER